MAELLNRSLPSYDYSTEANPQTLQPLSDEQLIQCVSNGNEQAFGELYQRFSSALFNYLRNQVNDDPVAEDLLQETFVAVWHGACRFRGQARVKTWMFQIAHNQMVSWMRKKHKLCSMDERMDRAGEDSPERSYMESAQSDRVRQALDQLSPEHRAVVELAFFYELSYREISQVIGCPVGTVKSRMSYARRYLTESLKDDWPDGQR